MGRRRAAAAGLDRRRGGHEPRRLPRRDRWRPGERLRAAVAWGRAAVLLPGTQVPAPSQVDLVAVRLVPDPDPDTSLKEMCG